VSGLGAFVRQSLVVVLTGTLRDWRDCLYLGPGGEIMDCETGKKLHEKETAAREVLGRYTRSLKGEAPQPRHREEMARLRGELTKAEVDYSQHKEQCEVCRRR
jgi:hypothetical protein